MVYPSQTIIMKTISQDSPKKHSGLFYGWVIVWAMTAITGVAITMGSANFGFFVKPMREELGFSQATFGWMNTTRVLTAAASSVFLGRMLDKHGPKWILAAIGLLVGILMVLMGTVHHAWETIGIFAMFGFIGLTGGSQLLTSTTPAKWFIEKRAKAMAYVYLGVPVGIMLSFPVTQMLIGAYGWRATWMILGIAGAVIVVPVSILLLRAQPEDMGLLPDGAASKSEVKSGSRPALASETQWTRHEALRTKAFWALTLAFGVQMFATATINVFRVPYFQDQGISDRIVSLLGPMEGMTAAVMALCVGSIATRVGGRNLAVFGFLLLATSISLVSVAHGPTLMFMSSATWGFSLGILMVLQSTIWADFFGRSNVGSIRGYSMMIVMAFSAAGGPLTGYIGDLTGKLEPVWWASAAALILCAFMFAKTRPPLKTPQPLAAEHLS
ncbi:MAG: MFS transporter [Dehalococcoidia bacterium]|nr:MFS transporter [Dehalococcoidia bacterium]